MKWEYDVISLSKFLNSDDDLTVQEQFDKYGAEGWELVCVLEKTFSGIGSPTKLDRDSLVFKRAIA